MLPLAIITAISKRAHTDDPSVNYRLWGGGLVNGRMKEGGGFSPLPKNAAATISKTQKDNFQKDRGARTVGDQFGGISFAVKKLPSLRLECSCVVCCHMCVNSGGVISHGLEVFFCVCVFKCEGEGVRELFLLGFSYGAETANQQHSKSSSGGRERCEVNLCFFLRVHICIYRNSSLHSNSKKSNWLKI